MKEEPMDLKDYLCLCEMWKKANHLQGANLHPRVVLYPADFQIHEQGGSPRLPHIKEEQEEVTIKQEEMTIKQEEVTIKQEEEQLSSSPAPLCVKREAEEDLPLLLLYDTPDRHGYIRALTFQRSDPPKPLDYEDFTKEEENGTGPCGCSDTDGGQTSSSIDPSENGNIEHRSGGVDFRIHKLKSGRRPSTKNIVKANNESTGNRMKRGQSKPSSDDLRDGQGKNMLKHKVRQKRDKGEKPVCSECGKSFAKKSNLKVHMRIHTGHYPFSCSICSQEFIEDRTLQRHMRSHTGERPFSCSECGKEFKQMAHYSSHLRIHSGERPFSCPVCKRGFYRSTHVTSHMKVHRRQKPFNCKVCYKGFMKKEGYTAHMEIHYVQEKYGVTSYGCFK